MAGQWLPGWGGAARETPRKNTSGSRGKGTAQRAFIYKVQQVGTSGHCIMRGEGSGGPDLSAPQTWPLVRGCDPEDSGSFAGGQRLGGAGEVRPTPGLQSVP